MGRIIVVELLVVTRVPDTSESLSLCRSSSFISFVCMSQKML